MFKKIKFFIKKILPSRRKIIQLYAALLYNANLKGFIKGEIFKGKSKSVCLPGLNCYSCPGAIGACPLGSLQNALSESGTKLPMYVIGIILLYAIILGRTICGFLCPVGLLQELLFKIKSPKLKKSKVTRCLSYFKYILLVVLVIAMPLIYGLQQNGLPVPGFCKYICPAGTFEGAIFLLSNKNNVDFFSMLGSLFTWKFVLLIIFIVASVFIFRFFCRFFCPLGAIYGIFNKLSILGVKVEKNKCTHCEACITNCKMDVLEVGDHECIQCGECQKVCPVNAIKWKTITKIVKEELEEERQNEANKQIKKTKKINKKTVGIIVNLIAITFLISVLVLVNCKKEIYKVGSYCDNLTITLNDENIFNIKTDNNSTLLYFYESLSDKEIDKLKKYSDEKLNIILINKKGTNIYNNVITTDVEKELNSLNIKFATDTKHAKLLKGFTEEKTYPYSVFIDFNDNILINKKELITESDYNAIISPSILGKVVGNAVGNICINKEITIINSDEKFSVVNNLGKITIINFWFDGCGPCIAELPHFNSLYEEYKDYVEVIAIHASGSTFTLERATNFVNKNFASYSISFGFDDAEASYYEMFGGEGAYPHTVVVDQDGVITYNLPGSMTEEALRNEIEKLIK